MYEGEACREQPVIYIEILLIYLFYLKKKATLENGHTLIFADA